jgi:hypothetical protein
MAGNTGKLTEVTRLFKLKFMSKKGTTYIRVKQVCSACFFENEAR